MNRRNLRKLALPIKREVIAHLTLDRLKSVVAGYDDTSLAETQGSTLLSICQTCQTL
jgi:hypothetical protein